MRNGVEAEIQRVHTSSEQAKLAAAEFRKAEEQGLMWGVSQLKGAAAHGARRQQELEDL